ncbi:MAG: hypothetical protein Q9227_003758 [Pyrenula ochraceoflavens]
MKVTSLFSILTAALAGRITAQSSQTVIAATNATTSATSTKLRPFSCSHLAYGSPGIVVACTDSAGHATTITHYPHNPDVTELDNSNEPTSVPLPPGPDTNTDPSIHTNPEPDSSNSHLTHNALTKHDLSKLIHSSSSTLSKRHLWVFVCVPDYAATSRCSRAPWSYYCDSQGNMLQRSDARVNLLCEADCGCWNLMTGKQRGGPAYQWKQNPILCDVFGMGCKLDSISEL